MSESTKRHEKNSNLIKEIRASTDAAIRNQGASIKTLEIQIGQISKVLQEREFGSLPSSTETNLRDQVKSVLTTIEADSYPICHIGSSQYVFERKMELDLEARLMGETLALNRSSDPFFEDYTELNDLNEPFKRRRDQGDDLMPTIDEGDLMNVPIFVRTFSVVAYFLVLEDMDAYRDEGMGDVIVGEPFLKEIGIKARRFEGLITIYNRNEEVSEQDMMNGISHLYQKLKGFYKGVLNLRPNYIRDAKMEEWLKRGHVSVHEME
ncbi:hypothetical protein Tco_0098064 [Tanacetum coccineum]